jgi:cysteine desulfurase / selenocysteine lyase
MAREKASVLSFTVADTHPHDIGAILDQESIAARVDHHTACASIAFYNTKEEIDALAVGIQKAIEVFA